MSGNARAALALATLVACLALAAKSAEAAGCPKKAVAENGGKHWCFSAGDAGHVHLWKPDGFKAKTAVTVVYIHGYSLSPEHGVDPCAKAHYVDCLWDVHKLSAQFEASGLNALFVAIEAPTRYGPSQKWTALGALLKSIRRNGGIEPPADVTVMAHSGGIYAVLQYLDNARLKNVVVLDGLYGHSPKRLTQWYRSDKSHRLTLVGAESRHAQTTTLGAKLGCVSVDDFDTPYPEAAKTVRCVSTVDANLGHMDLITDGRAIPLALSRAVAPKAKKVAATRKKKRRKHRR